jgi:hypothetical protein
VGSQTRKKETPSLISVLGLIDDAGDMMVDGVFPLPARVAVRPLILSRLSSGRASPWQREHAGSRPHSIIEESWGVLSRALMNPLHPHSTVPTGSRRASSPSSRKVW